MSENTNKNTEANLEQFLTLSPEELIEEELIVKAKNGKGTTDVVVKVKGLNTDQFIRAKKLSTCNFENTTSRQNVAQIEEITYLKNLCAAGITFPPLNNSELRKKYGVHSNQELVTKIFPTQSIIKMGTVIQRLTLGDDEDQIEVRDGTDPELFEQAKN